MRRLDRTRVIPIAMALSAMSLSPADAQDKRESGPTLEVHVRSLRHTGGVTQTMNITDWLVPGTPVTWHVTAGTSNPAEMTVCGAGENEMGTMADKLARSAFVWEVKMLPSRYENGTATFDLEWARYQNDGSGRPAAEGRARSRCGEGDRQSR